VTLLSHHRGDQTPRSTNTGGILNDGSNTGMFSAGPLAPAWGETHSPSGSWDTLQGSPRHGPLVPLSPSGSRSKVATAQPLRGNKPTIREEDLLYASQRQNVFSAYMNASVRGGLQPR
jgi:hypothetical protein